MKYFLITDNPRHGHIFSTHLSHRNIIFEHLENEDQIFEAVSSRGRKVVIMDHSASSFEALKVTEKLSRGSGNIVVTFGDELSGNETAELFKNGVDDMFTQPFIPEDIIKRSISLKKEKEKLEKESSSGDSPLKKKTPGSPKDSPVPTGKSRVVTVLRKVVKKIAPSNATVLITGESGTGKEVFSRYLHSLSKRKNAPFVPVNCGAIPENLLESELFGHVKGSFTGAYCDRKGRFEMAEGGTIFLDEVGEIPLHLQVKLLRVLQENEIQPVGSNEIIPVNARVVTATNKNLKKEVKNGGFREDLFYRLEVIPISVPPLKKRKEDIPVLVKHFIGVFNKKHGLSVKKVDKQCMETMSSYEWPGNIRELKNTVERFVVMKGSGVVNQKDLPPKILGIDADPMSMLLGDIDIEREMEKLSDESVVSLPETELFEKCSIPEDFSLENYISNLRSKIIENVVSETKSDISEAARILKISQSEVKKYTEKTE